MDRLKLINEIRKRPALWDFQSREYKSRLCVPEMWREVSNNMGLNVTVEECKRKWKNLRDAYRAEVKRIEMRIASDVMKGVYDSNYEYAKWSYYEHMNFIKDIKRPRRNIIFEKFKSHNQNIQDSNQDFGDYCKQMHFIKADSELKYNSDESYSLNNDDYDNNNDLYEEQLLNETQKLEETKVKQPLLTAYSKRKAEDSTSSNCKCSKRMNFLKDSDKEEQSSLKSPPVDISYSSNIAFIGDSDYNFLVSFLQQMKRMNDLQNLQFRAEISSLVYNIMSASTNRNILVSSTLTGSHNA